MLAANPRFFKGRPGLDRVVVQIVPDENTAINLLRTHAIDYMFQASIATYPALKDAPGTRLVWVNMNAYDALEINVSHVTNRVVRLAPSLMRSIRKAWSYASRTVRKRSRPRTSPTGCGRSIPA